jgi:hypothetical protein
MNPAILATSLRQTDKKLLDEAISGGGGGGALDPNAIHTGDAAGGELTGTYPDPTITSATKAAIALSARIITATPNGTQYTIGIDDTDLSNPIIKAIPYP